ncbi:MAG: gliding motility-associated C-terminal domain-containing protein [Saprospiraceae bacterium]|nr:gliding motility-associated C-terminal domain-containing protein [Saprospiraceae bacterium]
MRRIDALPFFRKSIFFCSLLLIPLLSSAQPGLVLNEISQGSTDGREFAEFVVVGDPCSTVDLRGWIFDDNNGEFVACAGPNNGALSGTGIATGHIRFKMDPIWQAVPVGTIILVYAFDPFDPAAQAEIGALTPDYTDVNCDFVRVCPINASNTFMEMDLNTPSSPNGTPCPANRMCPNGVTGNPTYAPANYIPLDDQSFAFLGRLGMRNDGDAFQARMPNGTFFHGMSYGTADPGCTVAPILDGGPDGLHLPSGGANMAHQFINTVNDDFRDVINFTSVTASTSQSPGRPNSCANAAWIASLRRPPESIFQSAGGGCNTNLMAPPASICIGEQLTVNFPPNTNACSSDSYSWNFSGSGGITILSGTSGTFFTFEGASAGTVNITITATLSNSLLYTQGGCSGPMFPESLDYTFPITISNGPTANPANLSACNNGNGQATYDLTSLNNTVNGGTGLPVTWYSDSQGNFPIANPGAYTTAPTIVYAQVTDGPCISNLASVILNLLPAVPAMNAQIIGCDQGGGIGLFDLTSIENIINLGSGNAVSFWQDPLATVAINNPGSYSGSTGVIFATVSDGNCNSAVVQVNLFVDPAPNPNNAFITVSPTSSCGPTTVTVSFVMPGQGVYEIELAYGNGTNGYQLYSASNITSGSTASFPITESTEFILTGAGLQTNSNCFIDFNTPVTLEVLITTPPDLNLISAPVICAGTQINLNDYIEDLNNTGIPITFHSGTPPTPGNQISPLVSPGVTTTYYAFADGGTGCQDTQAILVTVTSGGTPVLGSTSLCDNAGLFDLTTLQDPNFPNGTWSGTGVTGTDFDPTGLSGPIQLTFTPTDCGNPAMTTITVDVPGTPVLGTTTLCETDGVFDLNTLLDPNYPNGTWSGPGVMGSSFDPAGFSGTVGITFTPSGSCASPANTTIEVQEEEVPVLSAAQICAAEPPFDLTQLQDLNYPFGQWSGPGVTGSTFDPSGQSGTVTVTYTYLLPCVATVTTTVTLIPPIPPTLDSAALCESAPLLDLNALEDPNVSNGSWSGPGVNGDTFDPAGQSGTVTLTFTPNNFCLPPATTNIEVLTPPVITNLSLDCDQANTTYTVSFDISGGDGGPYFVDGVQLPGNTFTSLPILSGDPYSFDVDDGNNCGPVLLLGTNNCLCTTDAGTIDFAAGPIYVCEGSDFSVASFFNNNEFLDGNDVLQFILHDNPGLTLGTILATSPDGAYTYPAGATLNQSYYVSPVAGNDDGMGGIDLTDDCLSVAPGIEVIFYQLLVSTNTGAALCADECFDWEIAFSGLPNFTLNYEVQTSSMIFPESVNSVDSTVVITICPADYSVTDGVINLEITSLDDANCTAILSETTTLNVLATPVEVLAPTLCSGESLLINGTTYDESNPSGTELFPNGAVNGCDSTLQIDLSFQAPVTTDLIQTLCPGESVTVNGVTYDEAMPSGVEILTGASQFGCDSTVTIDLSFYPAATEDLIATLCEGESIDVNGTTYDEANPSGTEILIGASANGCDSTVTIQLSFLAPGLALIDEELCTGSSILVNGTTYDEAMPSGTEIFQSGAFNGCDSIVTIDLTFNTSVSNLIDPMLCMGESVTVNGVLYDETTPTGQEIIIGGSYLGCDSIIDVNLSFFAEAETLINPTLCFGEELVVNGSTYNAASPIGTEILVNAAATGCDSIIQIDLSFYAQSVNDYSDLLCAGESVIINGTTYDEAMPMGTEILPGAASTGCDSTINVSLSFLPAATGLVDDLLCPGGTVTVNGNVYDEMIPSGTEVLIGASANGCDSTVVIDLSFNPPASSLINDQLCPGESVVVNGNVYDQITPAGSETIMGGSYLGCDSTILIDLSFLPISVGNYSETLCPGGSVVINGTTYDGDMPMGIEVFPNAAYTGCDSVLNVAIDFAMPATGNLNEVLCEGESIFINGTLYNEANSSGTELFVGGSYLGCDSTLFVNVNFLPVSEETITLVLNPGESITVNGVVYDADNLNGTEVLPGASANGCDSIVIVSLSFNVDDAQLQALPPTCFGGDNGTIIIDSLPLAVAPYLVSVDGLAFGEFDFFPITLTGLVTGPYDITVIDGNGDFFSYQIDIPAGQILNLNAGDDIEITLGESTELNATSSFFADSIIWSPAIYLSCDSCANTDVITPLQTIEYTITAFDTAGCVIQDVVEVRVSKEYKIYVPNIFSPDGNGLNDEFVIYAGPEVANIRVLQIFDRWGDMVFQALNIPPNDPKLGWDGSYRGQQMNPAVYVYYFEVEFIDGTREILKGDLTLIR